jgi:hypothetical protein
VHRNCAYISFAGTATWTCSQAFLDAANALLENYEKLTIDLGACEYLDRTCLGTLHEIVNSRPDAVQLQRLPASIRTQFEELSMAIVLNHAGPETEPLPNDMEPLQRADVDAAGQGARMLSAHETLSSLSPDNREVFQGVVESLRADLDQNE